MVSSLKHTSTTTVSSPKTYLHSSTTTVSPETTVASPETAEYSSNKLDDVQLQVSRNRIYKRQTGRANMGGCENEQLSKVQICMLKVVLS